MTQPAAPVIPSGLRAFADWEAQKPLGAAGLRINVGEHADGEPCVLLAVPGGWPIHLTADQAESVIEELRSAVAVLRDDA